MCRGPRPGPATALRPPAITRSSRRLIPSFSLLARVSITDLVATDRGYIPNYPNFRLFFQTLLHERLLEISFRIFTIVEKIVYYTPLFAGVLWSPNYGARGGYILNYRAVFCFVHLDLDLLHPSLQDPTRGRFRPRSAVFSAVSVRGNLLLHPSLL